MFKKLFTIGVIGFGTLLTTPAMAHSYTNNHSHNVNAEVIFPINTHPAPVNNHYAPVNNQHQCVWNNNVNQRQAKQASRINSGIRSGELTQWEAKQLQDQQARIRRAEQGMLRSGNCLNRVEVNRLNHMLDDANRYIRSLKHNNVRVQYHHHHNNHGGHRGNHR